MKRLGIILAILGLLLMAGVIGMDDMTGASASLMTLAVRLLIPLGMLGIGTVLMNGGTE